MQNRELIEYSLNEEFKYRHLLNFGIEPFGIEIEMEGIDYNQADRWIRNKVDSTWNIKDDRSLNQGGMEIASPVLLNRKEVWKLLLKLSKTLQCLNPTFENASFQVNLDNHLSLDQLTLFLKFFATYEDIIYRFSKGTDSCLRQTVFDYAFPITPTLENMILDGRSNISIKYQFQERKKYAINFKTGKQKLINNKINVNSSDPIRIIEFRTSNGTVNPLLWQNYINTFYHILRYVSSNLFDADRLEYRWLRTEHGAYIEDYVKIDIEKAIEFANLIFKEDIDKLYFLKQYIGTDVSKVKVK